VTGSIGFMVGASSSERTDGDLQVAERVDTDAVPRLDHRRGVELFHDRRPRELDAGPELLAPVDRRVVPAAVEPRTAAPGGGGGAGRAVECEEALERDRAAPADDGRSKTHDLGAHLAQLDLEALPVRPLEAADEV